MALTWGFEVSILKNSWNPRHDDNPSWRDLGSVDTRSGGCEREEFTYATWSATGTGIFDLTGDPTLNLTMTTFCNPPNGSQLVHSPNVLWTFIHNQTSDTVLLVESVGTTYTRLP